MSQWRGRVEELLYDGESVTETVDVGSARVVVTSHRVLAFASDTDGPNFRQVDRPNVVGVSTGAQTRGDLLERTVRVGVIGVVLVAAGWVLDFGAIVGDVDLTGGQATGQVGIGGILGPLQTMLAVLSTLDLYMQLVGALCLLLAVVLFGVYWMGRTPTLVIEVAGEDDIHVPRPDESGTVVERLERAVVPESPGETSGTATLES